MSLFEGDFFSLARAHVRLARYEVSEMHSELDILTRKLRAIASTHFIDALTILINSPHTPLLARDALSQCRPNFRTMKRQIEESSLLSPSDLNRCWGMLETACDVLGPGGISTQPLKPDEKAPGEVQHDADGRYHMVQDATEEGGNSERITDEVDVAEETDEDDAGITDEERTKEHVEDVDSVVINEMRKIRLDDGERAESRIIQQHNEPEFSDKQGELTRDEEAKITKEHGALTRDEESEKRTEK
ncbi:hypothetical protein BDZ45DRAFT_746192 [Acephala macrosclerotiorum]|nr:hypothetical protein BDZ45DRAFT_746192 [Acephala macrosclerotiorum]